MVSWRRLNLKLGFDVDSEKERKRKIYIPGGIEKEGCLNVR